MDAPARLAVVDHHRQRGLIDVEVLVVLPAGPGPLSVGEFGVQEQLTIQAVEVAQFGIEREAPAQGEVVLFVGLW